MNKDFIGGAIGTSIGVVGTATQTNDVLQTISLIITIIGAIISMIVVPLISWYQKAKKDGKITSDEIKEGVDVIAHGVDEVNKTINKKGEHHEKHRYNTHC